jgi:hypothetical protein
MTTFIVSLANGSSCEIDADGIEYENGVLLFTRHLDLPRPK